MLKVQYDNHAILRSVQSENYIDEDVYLQFHSPPWDTKFLFQLDNVAQVSVVKKSKLPHTAVIDDSDIITISGIEKSN